MADHLPDGRRRRCSSSWRSCIAMRLECPIPVVQDTLLKIDLSWAQELCIYMFVWMAKFGAAYGVRTGIHVGVDVLINRLPPRWRRNLRAVRPVCGRVLHRDDRHIRRKVRLGHGAHRPDVARPRDGRSGSSICAIPLGSYLMCYPLPAGGVDVLAHRRTAASTTRHTSKALTCRRVRHRTRPSPLPARP